MKRIVIIGLGDVSIYVIKGILKTGKYEIVGVCDTNAEKLHKLGMLFTNKVFADYRTMLRKTAFDYIVLLVHQANRLELLLELIQKGYRIFCEKPLVCSAEQFHLLTKVCQKNDNYPIVIYHRSFSNRMPEIYDLLEKTSVIKIEIFYLEDIKLQSSNDCYEFLTDYMGGGCIQDNFPNCIDFILRYSDVEITQVTKEKSHSGLYYEKAQISLRLKKSNVECTVFLNWNSPTDNKSVKIYGLDWVYSIDFQSGYDIPKESLIDEYQNFFAQTEWPNAKSSFIKEKKITEMIEDILHE